MVLDIFVSCKQPEHLKKLNYTKKIGNKLKEETLSGFQHIFHRDNKVSF